MNKITKDSNFTKLDKLDKLIYENRIQKCIDCKGYEFCTQDTQGLMPIISEYKFVNESKGYKLFSAKCPKRPGNIKGSYKEKIIHSTSIEMDETQKTIANKIYKNNGGFLFGNAGTGKTSMFSKIANVYRKKGKDVHFELARNITASFQSFVNIYDSTEKDSFSYKLAELQSVDVLFIDDFYREKLTEWSILNVWSAILQTRIDNGKPTYVSCNYTPLEVSKKLAKEVDIQAAETIVGRFNEIGIYELNHYDYRTKTNY